jgi:hypothetical protein
MPPAEFEPAITASERPQTHALDRTVTGIGKKKSPFLRQIQHCYSLYTKIVPVCCEDYSKHTKQMYRKNTVYNVEQHESISCFHWALKSSETNNLTQLRTTLFPNLVTNPQLFIRSKNSQTWIYSAWFQASASKQERLALFWDITQCRVVIPYRQTFVPESSWTSWPLKMGPIVWFSRNVCTELPLYTA